MQLALAAPSDDRDRDLTQADLAAAALLVPSTLSTAPPGDSNLKSESDSTTDTVTVTARRTVTGTGGHGPVPGPVWQCERVQQLKSLTHGEPFL